MTHIVASTRVQVPVKNFSMVDHQPCARFSGDDVAIAEAGQGITLMFVTKPDTSRLIYTVWRNNGGSSTHWQMENEPFSLDSGSVIKGAVGRHLLLYYVGSLSVERGCYTRDVDTLWFISRPVRSILQLPTIVIIIAESVKW